MNGQDYPTPEEFRKYAEEHFSLRVDRMWDNVDDWIKYGDLFIQLKFPTQNDIEKIMDNL